MGRIPMPVSTPASFCLRAHAQRDRKLLRGQNSRVLSAPGERYKTGLNWHRSDMSQHPQPKLSTRGLLIAFRRINQRQKLVTVDKAAEIFARQRPGVLGTVHFQAVLGAGVRR